MYYLSKALTGVILEHDKYGYHLNCNGKTVDKEQEIRNFSAAGQTLCLIWNELMIDGFATTAEFKLEPPAQEIPSFVVSNEFRSNHIFESQYHMAYLKCYDEMCCEKFITNVEYFFPQRLLPP